MGRAAGSHPRFLFKWPCTTLLNRLFAKDRAILSLTCTCLFNFFFLPLVLAGSGLEVSHLSRPDPNIPAKRTPTPPTRPSVKPVERAEMEKTKPLSPFSVSTHLKLSASSAHARFKSLSNGRRTVIGPRGVATAFPPRYYAHASPRGNQSCFMLSSVKSQLALSSGFKHSPDAYTLFLTSKTRSSACV